MTWSIADGDQTSASPWTLAGAPRPRTVLSMQPWLTDAWQRGELWKSPNTRKEVAFSLVAGIPASIAGCVDALDARLISELATFTNIDIDVYGHSNGAEVIDKWLREKGPTGPARGIDPARVRFIKAANPSHRYNGRFTGHTAFSPGYALYGPPGYPDDTPYSGIEFTRQYDWASDYPNVETNMDAMNNSSWGFITHIDYYNVGLDDPGNVKKLIGNFLYIWSPTFPLPMLGAIGAIGPDKQMRPRVERGYTRPAQVTGPDYANIPWWR